MKVKRYPIQIWFLSEDVVQSAQWLSNKLLAKTVMGCVNALNSARFYYAGIRSMKFYKHFFAKERKQQTMEELFPLWPLAMKPSFNSYTSKTSKWTRMCREHYDYVKMYMNALLDEYMYRYKKPHNISKFAEWLEFDAPKLNIPEGHLSKISLPWKCLNPKYRRKDICLGYRLQYKAFLENDGIKVDDFKNRDIPEFLLQRNSEHIS